MGRTQYGIISYSLFRGDEAIFGDGQLPVDKKAACASSGIFSHFQQNCLFFAGCCIAIKEKMCKIGPFPPIDGALIAPSGERGFISFFPSF